MKTYISYLVIALLMTHTLTAQVKIGDRPESLHNASVLELESNTRVLVITRLSDAQMNLINPLRGALVYNTDQDCLHYYNGAEWVNICEELDNSFTVSTRADHMRPINPNALDNTVVITETPNPDGSINYNFEVGIINGANIAPSAVNGDKIQNGSVGSQDLAPRSVGLSHLQDGGADGDLFQWNGSAWTLINQADITITEVDGIIGNEVVDATDGTLTRTGNGTDIPYTLGVSPLGIGTNELADDSVTNDKINANVAGNGLNQAADGSLEVAVSDLTGDGSLTSPGSTIELTGTPTNALLENVGIDVADNAITSSKILDGAIVTADIADLAITNAKLANNAVSTAKIGNSAVTSAKILNGEVNTVDLADGAVNSTKILDGTIATIDIADNAINSVKIIDGTIIAADIADGAVPSAKILDGTIATIDIADNAINSAKIIDGAIIAADLADDAVTSAKILDGTIATIDIADNAVNIDKIGTLGVADADRVLTTDAAGDPQWEDRANFASSALNDGEILVGDASNTAVGVTMNGDVTMDNTGLATIQPDVVTTTEIGTNGAADADRVLTTDAAGDPQWEDRANFASSALNDGEILVGDASNTAVGVTMNGDVTMDNTGLATIQPDVVTTTEIGTAGLTDANKVLATDAAGDPIWQTPAVVAMGKVDATATVVNSNGASVIQNGTGDYTVTLDSAMLTADYIVQLTLQNTGGSFTIEVTNQTTTTFDVRIWELSAPSLPGALTSTPINAQWFFTVTNF